MRLFIQIENGEPVNHPAFEQNLIEAFGRIPSNWEPFTRVPNPTLTDNSIVLEQSNPIYENIDGVWRDVWIVRPKTPEEIELEHQQRVEELKQEWKTRPYALNFKAWVLNEELLRYEPPLPRPNDGKFYRWHGPSNNWREAEPFPRDGKQYYFDFDNWINVEITNV